ncbi:MAG: phosphatase PAP2 family protein [Bryobacteraceae bacterium]
MPIALRGFLFAAPLAIGTALRLEPASSRPWSRVTRDWASLALILVGYWSLQSFSSPPSEKWQTLWVGWDRQVLTGLRAALEFAGPVVPFVLESLYLLLYAIPPIALGVLYACGARKQAEHYLLVLFLGTFSAYALLLVIPVESPRVAFPGADLPGFHGFPRTVNTWLLDRFDISTSVFPSGHVAVAFSSAFGLWTVLRHRPRIPAMAFLVALLVYTATVYGRYHYAVDGLTSILVTFVAWRAAVWLKPSMASAESRPIARETQSAGASLSVGGNDAAAKAQHGLERARCQNATRETERPAHS